MRNETLQIALTNLFHRRMRSFITLAGIVIGITAIVGLVSVGQGLQETIKGEFEKMGSNMVIVRPKGLGFFGALTASFSEEEEELIAQVRGIELSSPIYMKGFEVDFENEVQYTYLVGLSEESFDFFSKNVKVYELESGRMYEQSGEAVVGYKFTTDLFDKRVKLGDKIKVKNRYFEVVGSVAEIGNSQDDNSLYLSLSDVQELFDDQDRYSIFWVQVQDGTEPEKVKERIEEKFEREGIEATIETADELLESYQSILSLVNYVFYGIASISIVVGGVGVMNTMYMATTERTKEIGTMKAIGATNRKILSIFLMESGLLGLVGGAFGVLFGAAMGESVAAMARFYLETSYFKTSLSPFLLIGALLFSFFVGMVSGYLPARKAANLNPVDALRYE